MNPSVDTVVEVGGVFVTTVTASPLQGVADRSAVSDLRETKRTEGEAHGARIVRAFSPSLLPWRSPGASPRAGIAWAVGPQQRPTVLVTEKSERHPVPTALCPLYCWHT